MNSMARVSKLAELRARTDRELVNVIENEVELGLHLALKLLPKVEDRSERRRLERKLKQIREALDRESVPSESRVQAAYS